MQDGVNGFRAMTHDGWVAKLSRLIEDAVMRREMGLKALDLVKKSFTLEACAPKRLTIFNEVAQPASAVERQVSHDNKGSVSNAHQC